MATTDDGERSWPGKEEEEEEEEDGDMETHSSSEDSTTGLFKGGLGRTSYFEWPEAYDEELEVLQARRAYWRGMGIGVPDETLGVCFTGGGIRSAALCLGMLQRLAEAEMLHEVDYLSCVSGGSYAGAGLASDIVTLWREAPPKSPADVPRWYRNVCYETIRRFQVNANYPLQPLQCIRKLPSMFLQRLVGIICFIGVVLYSLCIHPCLTFVVFTMFPVVVFMDVFFADELQPLLCAPPYVCKTPACDNIERRGLFYNRDMIFIGTFLLVALFVVLFIQVTGINKSLYKKAVQKGKNSRMGAFTMTVFSILHGFVMLFKRFFFICLTFFLLYGLVILSQRIKFGGVESVWRAQEDLFQHSHIGEGWRLQFNLTLREFPTHDGIEDVIKFGTWYACYHYTMPYWSDRGWLSATSLSNNGSTNTVTPWSQDAWPGDQQCSGDLGQSYLREGTYGAEGDYLPFWSGWSFGSFYWGNLERAGNVIANSGPDDASRQDFYQDWHNSCSTRHETMCFVSSRVGPADSLPTAGCCPTTFFAPVLFLFFACLAVGLVLFVLIEGKIVLKVVLSSVLPLVALVVLVTLISWRVFGPITQAPSAINQGQVLLSWFGLIPYTSTYFWLLLVGTTGFTFLLLPYFEGLQRFGHLYNRNCLANAFIRPGEKDFRLSDCAQVPACPILLFGSALLYFRNDYPKSKPAHMFCISSHHIGSEATRYIDTPRHFEVARAMAVSAAALETTLLVESDSFIVRAWVLLLDLAQGDWVRVDPQNVLDVGGNPNKHIRRLLDALPSFCVAFVMYATCILAEVLFSAGSCITARVLLLVSTAIASLSVALVFFTPVFHGLMLWLQPSPILRFLQTLLLATPVTTRRPPPYLYLGDGGLLENTGALELLRRRTRFILVLEASGKLTMLQLGQVLKQAEEQKLCNVFVPGSESVSVQERIDMFKKDDTQTFIHFRVVYDYGKPERERALGDMFWCQSRTKGPRGWTDQPQVRRFPNSGSCSDIDEELPPMKKLNGCCWDGPCCAPCGQFPGTDTGQQFFSPHMSVNFEYFGYLLVEEALEALLRTRRDAGGRGAAPRGPAAAAAG